MFLTKVLNYSYFSVVIKESNFIKNKYLSGLTQDKLINLYIYYDYFYVKVLFLLYSNFVDVHDTVYAYESKQIDTYCDYWAIKLLSLAGYGWYLDVLCVYNDRILVDSTAQSYIMRKAIVYFTDILEFEWPLIFLGLLNYEVAAYFDILSRFTQNFEAKGIYTVINQFIFFIKKNNSETGVYTLLVKSVFWLYLNLLLRFWLKSQYLYILDFLHFKLKATIVFSLLLGNFSLKNSYELFLLDKINYPHIKSITMLYNGASWLERELSEFTRVRFVGLRDSRRLLLNYSHTIDDLYFKNNDVYIILTKCIFYIIH